MLVLLSPNFSWRKDSLGKARTSERCESDVSTAGVRSHVRRVPASEYERMRAPFQGGSFPYPVKYGYINVGRVESGPRELMGRTVFALYPHQDRFAAPKEWQHLTLRDLGEIAAATETVA